jgi:acyl-CoA reductase-like NAD-dependent aldehyde dehydrogenase
MMTTSLETAQQYIPENLPTHLQHFIDGKFVDSVGGKTFNVQDPVSNENYATVAAGQPEDIDLAVAAAKRAFHEGPWSKMLPRERSRVLHKIADIVESRDDELALLESFDSGLPITQAKGQARRAAENFRLFADLIVGQEDNAFKVPGRQINYVNRKPIGVAALITPWNVPFMQESWKLAPAIATGNTVVMKPASYTPLSAVLWPEIFREAGLPDGVLNVITGYGETTGAALTAHPDVDKISFTGSTEVGRLIVKAAAGNLKRLTLELGGKSPLIMFEDANLDKAIMNASLGLLAGSGQNCSCTSRIYVQRGIYDQVVEGIAGFAKMLPMGGSEDPDSVLGPLISDKQRQRVEGIVQEGVSKGAEIITGGKYLDRKGYFYEATVITNTTPDMRLIREEIFGPVGCVIPFDEEEEVLAAANDTEYGLAGAIWTENLGRAHRVANELHAGQVWVNCALGADPAMPICGHKQSGWGGERGRKGIEEYFNTKAVYISL